jgi:hypothetical protein
MGRASRTNSNASKAASKASRLPGPGTYELPGAFGRQPGSVKHSVSAYSMGRGSAREGSKTARAAGPGPGSYKHATAFGDQKTSRRESQPSFSMRGGPRVSGTSGQGADRYYNTPGAFGAQRQSVRASVSAYGFGTGPQRVIEKLNSNPGPGAYAREGAFGGQQSSQKVSAGAFSIGQANEKTSNAGTGSGVPGPGAYPIGSSFGKQQLGSKMSGCSYTMSGWNTGQEGLKPNGPGKYYDAVSARPHAAQAARVLERKRRRAGAEIASPPGICLTPHRLLHAPNRCM